MKKTLDIFTYTVYTNRRLANVAQSVEQLIRNQQVACSSHVVSFLCSGFRGFFVYVKARQADAQVASLLFHRKHARPVS